MSNAVVNPRVTLDIIRSDAKVGLEDQRGLIIGQISANAASDVTNGQYISDVPRTKEEINELFGPDSHLAMLCRSYREVNEYTNLSAIVLEDDGAAAKAAATLAFAGAATRDGELSITVVSEYHYSFNLEIVTGEDAQDVLDKLQAVVSARGAAPFTFAHDNTTGTFTAVNGGSIANNWPIKIEGRVPGLSYTLTGFTGGAVDPDLTTLFDDVTDIRFQGIVWPESYSNATIKNFIDPRKNVDNDVKDGQAFTTLTETLVTGKTTALGINSSEITAFINEPVDDLDFWKGPDIATAPDMISAYFCAARAIRIEDGISVSDLVSTNAPNDQFGGVHMHSLPFFNTPMRFVGSKCPGRGFSGAEQLELEQSGLSVLGRNRSNTATVFGQVVTTWQKDPAGNDDETWKYLNWRDTHGAIREYMVLNNRKRWAQSRLSIGGAVPSFDIATEAVVRAYQIELFGDLVDDLLAVGGSDQRKYFEEHLQVALEPENRRVIIHSKVPMMSQLGEIIGTVQYSFNTA
jgi:phage tail sheath gpL-like